jgi:hypothetical protein
MFSVNSVVMVLNGEYVDCVAYVREVLGNGKYRVEVPFIEGSEFTVVDEQDVRLLGEVGLDD